jgi:GDP/UDP-N,N'-diacetylbacillosamine 2-epimerase (hydrolysing)
MEIAILTSSRADFGFYKPLLNLLKTQTELIYKLVVFGTHLSQDHGYTINDIKASGYTSIFEVDAIPNGDKAIDIAKTIGNTHLKFAEFWDKNHFDLIICIGDRYEMFASVSASIPFNILIAHISGGEETLGAIDNVYRHSLTLMAKYHFTNTQNNAERVKQITGSSKNIYHTGSLAIDNINETKLYNSAEFKELFHFDIDQPFILFTFHPETVDYNMNEGFALIMRDVLMVLKCNVLVTMPNADTMGGVIREALQYAASKNKNLFLFESLGSKGYYTALKSCMVVLGNSSSGIIEAASFSKYVINIGNRQLGREYSRNVIHCKINKNEILEAILKIEELPELDTFNIYGDGKASFKIIEVLKKIQQKVL